MKQKKYLLLFFLILLLIFNLRKDKENFTNNDNFTNNNLNSIPIYCINLDKATERWDKVNKKFNKLNIKINRFPAVNGKDLTNIDNREILDTYNTTTNAKCDKNIKPNLILN